MADPVEAIIDLSEHRRQILYLHSVGARHLFLNHLEGVVESQVRLLPILCAADLCGGNPSVSLPALQESDHEAPNDKEPSRLRMADANEPDLPELWSAVVGAREDEDVKAVGKAGIVVGSGAGLDSSSFTPTRCSRQTALPARGIVLEV